METRPGLANSNMVGAAMFRIRKIGFTMQMWNFQHNPTAIPIYWTGFCRRYYFCKYQVIRAYPFWHLCQSVSLSFSEHFKTVKAMNILLRELVSNLRAETVSVKDFRRMLGNEGYAVQSPYIVYKDCRIAKFEVRGDAVRIFTHSKKRGYARSHRVRNLMVALHKLRESYRNFVYASEKPGVRLPTIRIMPQKRIGMKAA